MAAAIGGRHAARREFPHFIAFEIGRGPDGAWWVLGDRTQAPSGVGFALQNRVATARIFADYYAPSNVHRLAGFFPLLSGCAQRMRNQQTNRVSILTPGPLNETYFEHAYIARYLGFGLLEGEDLTFEDGELMVRTVAGPIPIDVLWRRLDSNFADPLELDPQSKLGTPGLVAAVRRGSVTLVNALGSGILEIRALQAFLPRISQRLMGQPLALPNIATWLVRAAGRGEPCTCECRAHADRRSAFNQPALRSRSPFSAPAGRAGAEAGASIPWCCFVGQEVVTLSTTPALVDGVLRPRPMSLRVFLARTPSGWEVMPGGYAASAAPTIRTALSMRRGGRRRMSGSSARSRSGRIRC